MAQKLTQDEFVAKSNKVHNNKYDYSQAVYVNSKTKLAIICPVHGVFYQTPNKHLDGRGCPDCVKNKAYTTETFITAAKKLYGNEFDYSEVNYINCNTEVKIKCNRCGQIFMQKPAKHLKGHKCPLCRYDRRAENYEKIYGVSNPMQRDEVKQHFRESFEEKYGVDNPAKSELYKQHVAEYTAKSIATKREHNTFSSSEPEEIMYNNLVEYFGSEDVERQYKSEEYPFACDFYIKSRDLYIELNANWTHGSHWFDKSNFDDMTELVSYKYKGTKYYQNAIYVWTKLDVKKRQIAMNNNLNYIVFWNNDLTDFYLWLELGCPDGNDAVEMYSWMR